MDSEQSSSPRKRTALLAHTHNLIPCIAVLFSFATIVLLFSLRTGSSAGANDYVCDVGETRIDDEQDCCPSVKNYICEDYVNCENVDPDCIDDSSAPDWCAGSNNEYNSSIKFGYDNSKNLCYPGHCNITYGSCTLNCDDGSDCTSGFCTAGACTDIAPNSSDPTALSLTSPAVAVFEGDDLQIPYTITYHVGLAPELTIDSITFEGVLGRFFKPEVKSLTIAQGTQETVMVNVDSFELSKMFIGYLEPGRYQVRANVTSGLLTAYDVLDVIVLPTYILQNTRNLPSQRTIGHMVRQLLVNDTENGRLFPVEAEVWVW